MTESSAEDAVVAPTTFGWLFKRVLRRKRVTMELHFWSHDCIGTCLGVVIEGKCFGDFVSMCHMEGCGAQLINKILAEGGYSIGR